MTGDKKWINYQNPHDKNQWLPTGKTHVPVGKANLRPKTVLLSVFWDREGVIHFELLEEGLTIVLKYYTFLRSG